MEKPADTLADILTPIQERWSPRAFAPRQVETEALMSVLEAGRWASSSRNEQPWRFIVAMKEDGEAFDRMCSCLDEKNQRWAQKAPVLMLVFARERFRSTGAVNRYSWHDVGAACAQMAVQAVSLGLFTHQMAGILRDRILEQYTVPEGYEPVEAVALGYPGNAEMLPEDLAEREEKPRTRLHPKEIFFRGDWGEETGWFPDEPDIPQG